MCENKKFTGKRLEFLAKIEDANGNKEQIVFEGTRKEFEHICCFLDKFRNAVEEKVYFSINVEEIKE